MKSSFNWFPEFVLRILAVLCLGFIVLNFWSVYKSYNSVEKNPLFPETLGSYTAFPHFIFILFYIYIVIIIWMYLRSTDIIKRWYKPILSVFFFEFFKMYIYGFLMWINPFG
ncbi:hypothetical protein OD90_1106 [Dokdonia sp. Hel_I_53]|nr:hypothetical protein OD90_1106 [Dokdonia sp. Hel_I_53]